MKIINAILSIIAPPIILYIQLLCCKELSNGKNIKFNIKNVIILLLAGLFILLNANINNGILRVCISFIIMMLSIMFTFGYDTLKSIVYTGFIYIFLILYEIILTTILVNFNLIKLSENILVKSIFSLILVILVYITCHNTKIKTFINKIVKKTKKIKYMHYILITVLFFLLLIDYKNYKNFSIKTYLNNILLTISFILIAIFAIYNYFKASKGEEKSEALLSYITKYEKTFEETRINRHEMLNNLLYLKSIENKNSDEYEKSLNNIIDIYSKNKSNVKNVYKLSPGIKGILYYKLFGLEEENFKININISKQMPNLSKKLSKKDYYILFRVVNILVDNAVEASKNSKEKIINIEGYKEKNKCILLIENSCDKKVDIKKVNEKNYSTKGSGHGLGLYIANTLLKDNEYIVLLQGYSNNIFTSKIIIK